MEYVENDIKIHAVYCAKYLESDPQSGINGPRTDQKDTKNTAVQCPSSSPSFKSEFASNKHIDATKNILCDSLQSFFPTRSCRGKRVKNVFVPCPFWEGAKNSIYVMCSTKKSVKIKGNKKGHGSDTEMKSDRNKMKCSEFLPKNSECKEHSAEHSKEHSKEHSSKCSWNVLHLAVRSGRLDVLRYILNIAQPCFDHSEMNTGDNTEYELSRRKCGEELYGMRGSGRERSGIGVEMGIRKGVGNGIGGRIGERKGKGEDGGLDKMEVEGKGKRMEGGRGMEKELVGMKGGGVSKKESEKKGTDIGTGKGVEFISAGSFQCCNARSVAVDEQSLCLCACFYDKLEILHILESIQDPSNRPPFPPSKKNTTISLLGSPKKKSCIFWSRSWI